MGKDKRTSPVKADWVESKGERGKIDINQVHTLIGDLSNTTVPSTEVSVEVLSLEFIRFGWLRVERDYWRWPDPHPYSGSTELVCLVFLTLKYHLLPNSIKVREKERGGMCDVYLLLCISLSLSIDNDILFSRVLSRPTFLVNK